MINMEQSIVINRPCEEVFAFLVNPENETQWQAELVDSKFTSNGAVGIGTTGRDLRQFMGRPMETTWEVTEFQPGQKLGFRIIKGPIPFQASYVLEPVEDGTKINLPCLGSNKRRIQIIRSTRQSDGAKTV